MMGCQKVMSLKNINYVLTWYIVMYMTHITARIKAYMLRESVCD